MKSKMSPSRYSPAESSELIGKEEQTHFYRTQCLWFIRQWCILTSFLSPFSIISSHSIFQAYLLSSSREQAILSLVDWYIYWNKRDNMPLQRKGSRFPGRWSFSSWRISFARLIPLDNLLASYPVLLKPFLTQLTTFHALSPWEVFGRWDLEKSLHVGVIQSPAPLSQKCVQNQSHQPCLR